MQKADVLTEMVVVDDDTLSDTHGGVDRDIAIVSSTCIEVGRRVVVACLPATIDPNSVESKSNNARVSTRRVDICAWHVLSASEESV